MIQIAKCLNRTLVIPSAVEHANDEPSKSSARKTWDLNLIDDTPFVYEDDFDKDIDLAYRIIPLYLLTNVKLNDIEDYYNLCPGSKKTINEPRTKHLVKQWNTCLVKTSFNMEGIKSTFTSDHPTIFISYAYDLCIHWTWPISTGWDIRIRIHQEYQSFANNLLSNLDHTCACHVRRGDFVTFLQITQSTVTLPPWELFQSHVSKVDANHLFVASDDHNIKTLGRTITYPEHFDHPLQYALMDMAVCIQVTYFFGTQTSTFSQYVHHVRNKNNKHSMLL